MKTSFLTQQPSPTILLQDVVDSYPFQGVHFQQTFNQPLALLGDVGVNVLEGTLLDLVE